MDPIIPIGKPAPDFSLPGLDGRDHSISEVCRRILVINFWSAECPWSERADQVLADALKGWSDQVLVWTIASNASETIEQITAEAARRGLAQVLVDVRQKVADLYKAQTTPHLFVVDPDGTIRYQGALDDVTFRRRTPTIPYLRQAVDALLAGHSPDPSITPPYGCTIVRSF